MGHEEFVKSPITQQYIAIMLLKFGRPTGCMVHYGFVKPSSWLKSKTTGGLKWQCSA